MIYGSGKYSYELLKGWAKYPEEWALLDVCGLAIDTHDKVYVLNRSAHPVIVFDCEGNRLATWGEGLFRRAHGAGIGPDSTIYCTDDELHVVYKFSPEGELLQTLGNKGIASDTGYDPEWFDFFWSLTTITQGGAPFNRPTGVAVTTAGDIYVSDGYGNARVHKFSPDGSLLLSWGEPGFAPGQFRLPHFICLDKQENVWVPDRENNRIQIFNPQGKLIDEWTDLVRPTDVCIDKEGTVYVTELGLRVSIFNGKGKLLTRFGNEDGKDKETALFLAPHTIRVDSKGDLYIGEVSKTYTGIDKGMQTLQKFIRQA